MPRTRTRDDGSGPPGFAEYAAARYPALVRLGTLLSGDPHHGEDLAQLGLLAELPAPQRLVLVLRFWLDLSEQDTADALGCSVGTVKSRTSRALARLRATSPDRPGAGVRPGNGVLR
ncbi:hypothetical protein NUM3379_26660 [Kineococcus sp. NUM-3379]